MAPALNWSIKGVEICWWCWSSFYTWPVSSLFNLLYVHRKLKQTLATCGQHGAIFFSFLASGQNMEDPTNLKLVRYFCPQCAFKKNSFWFLLLLRTSAAKICKKKNGMETQSVQSPRLLWGWHIKDIVWIYNFVKGLHCELWCFVSGRGARS